MAPTAQWQPRLWGRRGQLLLTFSLAVQCSCNWEAQRPSDPTHSVPTQTDGNAGTIPVLFAANGSMVSDADARERLSELTRLVALALADKPTRALVYGAIQSSCVRERKLDFKAFTDGPGARLLETMAAKGSGGLSAPSLAKFRDSTPELELYMPVPDHWSHWKGQDNVIVAASLYDHEPVIAFDLDGRSITGLSPDVAPATPVLSLVPAETDFRSPARSDGLCEFGAATGDALRQRVQFASAASTIAGVYLTNVHLSNTGEGFLRGSPEIEAMLMGPIADTMTLAMIDCANESRTGARYYNQDDQNWTGNLLVADSAQLATIKSKYPTGTPWDRVRYSIAFWEDDTQRCKIATNANNWRNLVLASMLTVVGGAAWIGNDWNQPNSDDAWPFLIQLPLGTLALIEIIGSNDDNLGMVIGKAAWNPMHSTDVVPSSAVLVGNIRNGTATLVWRQNASPPPPPPPAPFTVTGTAPSSVTAKGTFPLTGSANYPASGWRWERSTNGGATWSLWASTQNASFVVPAGENYTAQWRLFAKRSSDAVSDDAYASTLVCTVTGGCGLH